MARREDWPNDKIVCFRIAETFTEERDGKKWTSKTVKYESYRYSWESERHEINEHMFNKYYAKVSDNYFVVYSHTEMDNNIVNSVSNSTTWGEE